MALKYHPDHNSGDPKAEEKFKEIAEAYGVLIDPAKRSEFDRWLRTGDQDQAAGANDFTPGAGAFVSRHSPDVLQERDDSP